MSRLLNKKTNLIRLIHIAKQQVGMSEGDYRTMLATVSRGKTSSKDLTAEQLETVLRYMKAQGFEVSQSPSRAEEWQGFATQYDKLRDLWKKLYAEGKVRHNTDHALHSFCAKHGGETWRENGNIQSRLIERLKNWLSRD
jgi:putative phage regluatory protein